MPRMTTKTIMQRISEAHSHAEIGRATGFPYQRAGEWVKRGFPDWRAIRSLEPLLPDGVTVEDLYLEAEAMYGKRGRRAGARPAETQPAGR